MMSFLTWDQILLFFQDQFLTNDFFSAAAVFSLLGAVWAYAKEWPSRIWDRVRRLLFYSVTVYETNQMYGFIEMWLSHHRKSVYRNVELEAVRPDDNYDSGESSLLSFDNHADEFPSPDLTLRFKQFVDHFYLLRRYGVVKVVKGRERLENASSLRNAYLNRFEFSGFFAKKVINVLMDEILQYNNELQASSPRKSIRVMVSSGQYWENAGAIHPKPLSAVFFDGKQEIVDDVESFLSGREWYAERGIPYKRGYMLSGPPGNGKTTLAMSIAQHIKRSIFLLTMSKKTSDKDLVELFRNLSGDSVLVIEDIDAVFGIDRKSESAAFSFSTLLNCLDGALSPENVVVFFTTNHPEKIDSALKRCGRVDKHVEIGHPSSEIVSQYLSMFYDRPIEIELESECIPMVNVQNICLENKYDADAAIAAVLGSCSDSDAMKSTEETMEKLEKALGKKVLTGADFAKTFEDFGKVIDLP